MRSLKGGQERKKYACDCLLANEFLVRVSSISYFVNNLVAGRQAGSSCNEDL